VALGVLGAPAASHAQGARETIAISGHWEIEVRNPDGVVVNRREFDNHLAQGFSFFVPFVFLRQGYSLGTYAIHLSTEGQQHLSPFGLDRDNRVNGQRLGIISEADHDGPVAAGGLEHPIMAPNAGLGFILAGSATAVTGGSITRVSTRYSLCPALLAPPSGCRGDLIIWSSDFTTTAIAPLRLEAGQVVNVKVTIGFGSAPPPPSQ